MIETLHPDTKRVVTSATLPSCHQPKRQHLDTNSSGIYIPNSLNFLADSDLLKKATPFINHYLRGKRFDFATLHLPQIRGATKSVKKFKKGQEAKL
jgi:hypothetical protein